MNLAQLYGYPSMADNEMGPGLGYRGQQLMARRGRMLQMLGSRNFNDFGFHRYA